MKKHVIILAAASALALSSFVSAAFADIAPMTSNRHVWLPVANDSGVKFNYDAAYYTTNGGATGMTDNTYYLKSDGGGVNELHIANSANVDAAANYGYGQVNALTSNSTSTSGTFYVTNTGGRGYDNDIILMLSVTGAVADNFSLNIKSSGYSWTAPTGGAYQPPVPTDAAYITGINETFYKSDFQYGPQTAKPGPGTLGVWSLPLYYGQNISDSSTASYLMFIDLYVGNVKDGVLANEIDHGASKVEYSFTGLTPGSTVAFNGYGWCSASFQGEGISWTNRTNGDTTNSSDWSIAVSPTAAAPVPIPAAFWLLGSGLSGMFFMRRKKILA